MSFIIYYQHTGVRFNRAREADHWSRNMYTFVEEDTSRSTTKYRGVRGRDSQ